MQPSMIVLIKPASGRCNLRCQYCFYEDETMRREVSDYGMMTLETLEVVIQKTLSYSAKRCSFLFQGGEPTLVGLTFYEKVIEFQRQYNTHHIEITNSIQTNGTLLDEKWVQFFRNQQFLVGLSLDGNEETHNYYRKMKGGIGSFKEGLRAAQLLKQYEVPFNILTVVTDQLALNIKEVYQFYRSQDFQYLQFIPCLDLLATGKRYLNTDYYGQFLNDLFDLWLEDIHHHRFVFIRYFDDLINILCQQYPTTCGMLGRCGNHYVIEANGNVYPCDFYVLDEYELGNIKNLQWKELEQNRVKIGFNDPILIKPTTCLSCQWYRLCYGGCRREREPILDETNSLNQYCQAYQYFFTRAYPTLGQLATIIKNQTLLLNS